MSSNLAYKRQSTWSLTKEICHLAIPMAGSRLVNMLVGFIGMLMLAHLGHTVLAASALISSTWVTTFIVFLSIMFATGVAVSQLNGAQDYAEIGRLVHQACTLALVLSIPMMVVTYHMGDILLFFHQKPDLVFYANQFFHTAVWLCAPYAFFFTFSQFMYGIRKQNVVLRINTLGLILFSVFAYAFIYGHFGFAKRGVRGLADAQIVQAWFNLITIVAYVYFKNDCQKYAVFKWHSHIGLRHVKTLFRIGWPMFVQFSSEISTLSIVAVMVGWMGEAPLAALQIVNQCVFLVIVPMFTISEAAGIMVGQYFGAKQFHMLKRAGNVCAGLVLVMALTVLLVFLLFPTQLASLYMNVHKAAYAETLHLVTVLFALAGVWMIFDTVRNIYTGSLRGLFDTRAAMYISLFVMWVLYIPVGYLCAFRFGFGVVGFSMGSCIALFVGMLGVMWHWYRRLKHIAQ